MGPGLGSSWPTTWGAQGRLAEPGLPDRGRQASCPHPPTAGASPRLPTHLSGLHSHASQRPFGRALFNDGRTCPAQPPPQQPRDSGSAPHSRLWGGSARPPRRRGLTTQSCASPLTGLHWCGGPSAGAPRALRRTHVCSLPAPPAGVPRCPEGGPGPGQTARKEPAGARNRRPAPGRSRKELPKTAGLSSRATRAGQHPQPAHTEPVMALRPLAWQDGPGAPSHERSEGQESCSLPF